MLLLLAAVAFHAESGFAQTREYALMHQGNMAFNAKEYDKAEDCYMKVLAANPKNARALFNLADTYLAKNNAAAADSLYEMAGRLEPNRLIRAMASHNRGYILQTSALQDQEHRQQLLREAIKHYKQALRLNPKDDDTRYNLALCQKQLKDEEDQKQNQPQQQNRQQQQPQQDNSRQNQAQQQQQQPQPNPQDNKQTEQYLNLVKQEERKTLEKLKAKQPRRKSLDKNW